MWSALVVGSLLAAILVTAVGVVERRVNRRMGARPA
jgi:NitT/TauT family transport system permease protein